MRVLVTLCVLASLACSLSPSDREKISSVFNGPIDSLKSAYQVTVARSILELPLLESTCNYVAGNTQLALADLYFASHISKIQGCEVKIAGIEDFLNTEIAGEGASMNTLFKAVTSLSNFGMTVDSAVSEKIAAKVKEEDTVTAHSLAYLATAVLPGEVPKDLVDSIEDIAHRADTIGNAMSFEGGLMETSLFLKGASVLSQKAGKAALTDQMTQKFANYIVSNKDKAGKSNLFYTLVGLDALSSGSLVPTHLIVLDNSAVISESQRTLKVSLVNPLGVTVKDSTAKIISAKGSGGQAIFTAGPMSGGDGTFEVAASELTRGVFTAELGFELPSGYLAPDNSVVKVKCVLPVELKDATFKLIDVDDNRILLNNDLSGGAVQGKADLSTRLIFDFSLADGAEEVTLHQVFVRFTNTKTKQNVFFIAQADLKKKYTIDLNFRSAAAKSFGSVGGQYSVDLIVGDATLPQAMVIDVATLNLEIPDSKEPAADLSKQAKPEITHLFRQPEKRPPQAISAVFTGLVLLPALVLLIMWAKLGANISNIQISLSSIGFHGGLLAIIAIYVNFFLGVNMFTTVKCLAGVAVVTFLCGQRLLSSIAAAKKAK
ncbi:hypothetical protein ACHWQZ_G011567 [Mnemiopsis leidyi]